MKVMNDLVVQNRKELHDNHKDLLYTPKNYQTINIFPKESFSWFNRLQLVTFNYHLVLHALLQSVNDEL